MKPPGSRVTLAELMGLVALCAVSFALLTTPAALLGAGVLVILPGFILGRVRGGTGIVGGMISGCALPVILLLPTAVIELYVRQSTPIEYVNLLPALYMLLVICLVWSALSCSLLYLVDRRLQGPARPHATAPSVDPGIRFLSNDPEGIRFLPDEDRPCGAPSRGPAG
jgi:hypothetical protein